MKENNFEKQVQQKMDELKLNPSEEVWQKVSVAIAKGKNVRRIFAIVFLFLLLISSGIFITWNLTSGGKINNAVLEKNNPAKTNNLNNQRTDNNKQKIDDASDIPESGKKIKADNNMNILKQIPLTKKTGIQQKTTLIPEPSNTINRIPAETQANNKNFKNDTQEKKIAAINKTNITNYNTRRKLKVLISHAVPGGSANETSSVINDTVKTNGAVIIPFINDVAIINQVTGSVSREKIEIKDQVKDKLAAIPTTDNKKAGEVKKPMQAKQKGEWDMGINFSLGVAATQNAYLGIIGFGGNDEFKSYSSPAQSTSGNSGQVSGISFIPSKIKTGPGFVLGVFLEKSISPKTNFIVGLNYKKYSSAMMIGNRVDSSNNFSRANFFYRSGNQRSYKNNFHFIELPLALRFKLSKQNRLPFYLNTGVSISQLIGSDALQFESQSGNYYSDNSVFNKTQVSISAGLLFSLSGHAKNPILLGPDVNFSLNKMAKSGLYDNRHYSYFGIQVRKSIGKK